MQIGSELYNIADSTARSNASAASQAAADAAEAAETAQNTANTANQTANSAKALALKGFKVAFTSPDTITFTQITED